MGWLFMGRFEYTGIAWPPKGWGQFSGLAFSSGQSIAKDVPKARIYGLQYKIESVPLVKMETKLFRHDIHIQGWEYSILNESMEYPVLSLSLYDRFDPSLARECFVTDIRAYDTGIPQTGRSVNRAIGAALFFIKHIANGKVPDVGRALRTYKLHPNQAFLYRDDNFLHPDLKKAFETGLLSIKAAHPF